MKETIIKNKQEFLFKNYPFFPVPLITDQLACIHCDQVFTVGDFKVLSDETRFEFICCPNAPDCNGTVIDWVDLDYWNKGRSDEDEDFDDFDFEFDVDQMEDTEN
jgi:hypothetical protein